MMVGGRLLLVGGACASLACVGVPNAAAGDTVTVNGDSVSYWPSAQGAPFVEFEVDTKGYRNTYTLNCASRQFLWTKNVKLSTGQESRVTTRVRSGGRSIPRARYRTLCTAQSVRNGLRARPQLLSRRP